MQNDPLQEVEDVLSRRVPVDSIRALRYALGSATSASANSFRASAIVFDSNVILNIAKGRNLPDLADYLASQHRAPIVIPAQVVQEFWNNRLSAVSSLADQVRDQFSSLQRLVATIDPSYKLAERIAPILQEI